MAEAEGRLHAAQAQAALVPGLEERVRALEEKLRDEVARAQSRQQSEMQVRATVTVRRTRT